MAEAIENMTAGDDILASHAEQSAKNANDAGGFRDDLNAGETINGATLPVPIFIDESDSEVYACDANDTDRQRFDGFAISNSTDGNPIDIQTSGIVRGFSGLTVGERYYVQDAVGTIGTTPSSSNDMEVGIAISATELLILKGPRFFVSSGQTITTRGLSTSDLDVDVDIDCGFTPKYFEATIFIGLCNGVNWSSGSNTGLIAKGYRVKGVIGGPLIHFSTSYSSAGTPPSSVQKYRNPFGCNNTPNAISAGADFTLPGYGTGTMSSPSISATSTGTIRLASITVNKNGLTFNFTSSQSGSDDDVYYGISDVIIQG